MARPGPTTRELLVSSEYMRGKAIGPTGTTKAQAIKHVQEQAIVDVGEACRSNLARGSTAIMPSQHVGVGEGKRGTRPVERVLLLLLLLSAADGAGQ